MRILEYDQVDSLQVLHLNLLCLNFPLTKELADLIRHKDPRPFPFFCLYGQVEDAVAGQVGVFRLPVVSEASAEEVGGIWAVSTHPAYSRMRIAQQLLEEAHMRMVAEGFRYSTLGTDRYRVAHRLYEKLGYVDVFSSPSVIGPRNVLPNRSILKSERANYDRLSTADSVFEQISGGYLGFARRHNPFFPYLVQKGNLTAENLRLLWQDNEIVGYAVTFESKSVLEIRNLLLLDYIDPISAVTAVTQETTAPYVRVELDKPGDIEIYRGVGFQVTDPGWGTFMVKPLDRDSTVEDFRERYGVGAGRFLISFMDVT